MTEQPRSPPSAAQLTALYRYPVFNSASLLYPIILIIPECLNYSHSLLCWSVFCLVLSEALPHLSPILMARALISHGLWNSMLKKSLKIRTKCRGDERKSQNWGKFPTNTWMFRIPSDRLLWVVRTWWATGSCLRFSGSWRLSCRLPTPLSCVGWFGCVAEGWCELRQPGCALLQIVCDYHGVTLQ